MIDVFENEKMPCTTWPYGLVKEDKKTTNEKYKKKNHQKQVYLVFGSVLNIKPAFSILLKK